MKTYMRHRAGSFVNNNRLILLILTIFVTSIEFSLFAQSVQTGVVYEYDGKSEKKPLPNVEIVVNNAGSTVSDSKGKFTLNFRTLKPGDRITVRRCEKLGYEVFNTEVVSQLVITRDDTPITIVMCKSETLKKIRDNYTKIARQRYNEVIEQEEKSIKNNYDNGKISQKEYERKVEEMKRHYEDQLENIDNYIDRFTHIDLTEVSDVDKQVIDLLNAGKIDEAISKYDDEKIMDTYRTEIRDFQALTNAEARISQAAEKKRAELDQLKRTLSRQINLLWIAGGRDNVNKIVSLLRDVADADPTDYKPQLDYADLAMEQNNPAEAMRYYDRAFASVNGDVVKEAKVQIHRGEALLKLYKYDESLNISMTALHNLDSLIEIHNDSDLHLHDKAMAQTTIAKIFRRRREHDESLRYYSYAILEYEVLMELDSAAYAQDYANVMIRYGRELVELKDTLKAEEQIKRSIGLFENLQQANPQKNSGSLAMAYSWLGELNRLQGKFDIAEENMLKSANLYEYAHKVHPDRYLAGFAECNQNLGKLYMSEQIYDKSLHFLDIADSIYSKLAERNADMYTDKIAEVHLNKGTLAWKQCDWNTARYNDSIAVKRYEELYKISASAFNNELGQSMYYLGDCHYKLGDYVSANHCYRRASKYYIRKDYAARMKEVEDIVEGKNPRIKVKSDAANGDNGRRGKRRPDLEDYDEE